MSIDDIKNDDLGNLQKWDVDLSQEILDEVDAGRMKENEVDSVYSLEKKAFLDEAVKHGALKTIVAICNYNNVDSSVVEEVQSQYDLMKSEGDTKFAKSLLAASKYTDKGNLLLSNLLEITDPTKHPQTFNFVAKKLGLVKEGLLTIKQINSPKEIQTKDWVKIAAKFDLKEMFLQKFTLMVDEGSLGKGDLLEIIDIARIWSFDEILPIIAAAIVSDELDFNSNEELELLDACLNRKFEKEDGGIYVVESCHGSHVRLDGQTIEEIAKEVGNQKVLDHLTAKYPGRSAYVIKSKAEMKDFESAQDLLDRLEQQANSNQYKGVKGKYFEGFDGSYNNDSDVEGSGGSESENDLEEIITHLDRRDTIPFNDFETYDELVIVGEVGA